jgi:hypothetical protein
VDNSTYSPTYGQTRWVDNGAPASCSPTPNWVYIGSVRCQHNGSVYTGRQERYEQDQNPYSATYNQTRWVDNGAPASCSPTPNWVYIGSVRCQHNGSGYTGVQERYEQDQNPYSATYNQTRWVDNGNPSACPITPNYQPQSETRCQVDGGGNRTGNVEQKYRDVNVYSLTYNQEQWVNQGRNTSACPVSANWSYSGNQRCGGNGYVEREATDINPYSDTYNQVQWLQLSFTACTTTPDWVYQTTVCETFGGSNTGWTLYQYRDMNPFSSSYLQYDYSNRQYNPGACPVPCNWSNCGPESSGYRCVNGTCEYAPEVYMGSGFEQRQDPNTGWYTWVTVCYYRRTWSDGHYTDYERIDWSGWQSFCGSVEARNIIKNKKLKR